ncbi:hypothetical protein [Acidovorax sp. SD340]|uniref:hypothetical protein n=1 Tax=Acidovorax sp. SD340 TaxID=1690268 RepID=UPI00192E35C8|nr:hypothetical protein [Acidovorax sp. SD340]
MVAHAKAYSPYYRELYRDLPDRIESADQLPVTDKKKLMERFDEWCTDRAVTLGAAEALVDDPNRIGEWFLGKYTVMTTSGTTGRRGIFLVDDRTTRVVTAMMIRWFGDWLSPSDFLKIIARRGRMAMLMATGGHFASAVAAAGLKKRRGKQVEVLSAHMPMTELVARLNRFQPAMLAPYASWPQCSPTSRRPAGSTSIPCCWPSRPRSPTGGIRPNCARVQLQGREQLRRLGMNVYERHVR